MLRHLLVYSMIRTTIRAKLDVARMNSYLPLPCLPQTDTAVTLHGDAKRTVEHCSVQANGLPQRRLLKHRV